MSDTALSRGELVVRTIAQTAVDNETYFCELDAVVGDGDFGYSLARGFEIVISDWDAMEYSDISGLLKKTAITLTKRIGGTSGPIWGTAFLRAGGAGGLLKTVNLSGIYDLDPLNALLKADGKPAVSDAAPAS